MPKKTEDGLGKCLCPHSFHVCDQPSHGCVTYKYVLLESCCDSLNRMRKSGSICVTLGFSKKVPDVGQTGVGTFVDFVAEMP